LKSAGACIDWCEQARTKGMQTTTDGAWSNVNMRDSTSWSIKVDKILIFSNVFLNKESQIKAIRINCNILQRFCR
jgi:hypothetical protein